MYESVLCEYRIVSILYLNMFIYHYYDSYCKQQVKRLLESKITIDVTIDNLTKLIKTYSFRVGFDSFIHSFLNLGSHPFNAFN